MNNWSETCHFKFSCPREQASAWKQTETKLIWLMSIAVFKTEIQSFNIRQVYKNNSFIFGLKLICYWMTIIYKLNADYDFFFHEIHVKFDCNYNQSLETMLIWRNIFGDWRYQMQDDHSLLTHFYLKTCSCLKGTVCNLHSTKI